MTDHKNEYQKFADSAVRAREREEGFGRLRTSVFLGVAGGLAIFLLNLLKMLPPHKYVALAIVASAPLSIVLLIVNYIRLPNDAKASAPALMIGFITLLAAGGTIGLARYFDLFKAISPN